MRMTTARKIRGVQNDWRFVCQQPVAAIIIGELHGSNPKQPALLAENRIATRSRRGTVSKLERVRKERLGRQRGGAAMSAERKKKRFVVKRLTEELAEMFAKSRHLGRRDQAEAGGERV